MKLKESTVKQPHEAYEQKTPFALKKDQFDFKNQRVQNVINQASLDYDNEPERESIKQTESFRRKLNQSRHQMILNRKLSSVLDASPLKNSFIGKMIHDRYQNHLQHPDGVSTLASILNETLSKLKGRKPNKPILVPIA